MLDFRPDFAAVAQGKLRPEAARLGVLYWLGLCHVLMLSALERAAPARAVNQRLADMLVIGLTGLGIPPKRAREIARKRAFDRRKAE